MFRPANVIQLLGPLKQHPVPCTGCCIPWSRYWWYSLRIFWRGTASEGLGRLRGCQVVECLGNVWWIYFFGFFAFKWFSDIFSVAQVLSTCFGCRMAWPETKCPKKYAMCISVQVTWCSCLPTENWKIMKISQEERTNTTVDGWNLAPPGMYKTLLIMG